MRKEAFSLYKIALSSNFKLNTTLSTTKILILILIFATKVDIYLLLTLNLS